MLDEAAAGVQVADGTLVVVTAAGHDVVVQLLLEEALAAVQVAVGTLVGGKRRYGTPITLDDTL